MNLQDRHRRRRHATSSLSPLGTLVQREVIRLGETQPGMAPQQRAEIILLRCAYIFRDVTALELERALREGDPGLARLLDAETELTVARLVQRVLERAFRR